MDEAKKENKRINSFLRDITKTDTAVSGSDSSRSCSCCCCCHPSISPILTVPKGEDMLAFDGEEVLCVIVVSVWTLVVGMGRRPPEREEGQRERPSEREQVREEVGMGDEGEAFRGGVVCGHGDEPAAGVDPDAFRAPEWDWDWDYCSRSRWVDGTVGAQEAGSVGTGTGERTETSAVLPGDRTKQHDVGPYVLAPTTMTYAKLQCDATALFLRPLDEAFALCAVWPFNRPTSSNTGGSTLPIGAKRADTSLSKFQQVQLLEALAILSFSPTDFSGGTSLLKPLPLALPPPWRPSPHAHNEPKPAHNDKSSPASQEPLFFRRYGNRDGWDGRQQQHEHERRSLKSLRGSGSVVAAARSSQYPTLFPLRRALYGAPYNLSGSAFGYGSEASEGTVATGDGNLDFADISKAHAMLVPSWRLRTPLISGQLLSSRRPSNTAKPAPTSPSSCPSHTTPPQPLELRQSRRQPEDALDQQQESQPQSETLAGVESDSIVLSFNNSDANPPVLARLRLINHSSLLLLAPPSAFLPDLSPSPPNSNSKRLSFRSWSDLMNLISDFDALRIALDVRVCASYVLHCIVIILTTTSTNIFIELCTFLRPIAAIHFKQLSAPPPFFAILGCIPPHPSLTQSHPSTHSSPSVIENRYAPEEADGTFVLVLPFVSVRLIRGFDCRTRKEGEIELTEAQDRRETAISRERLWHSCCLCVIDLSIFQVSFPHVVASCSLAISQDDLLFLAFISRARPNQLRDLHIRAWNYSRAAAFSVSGPIFHPRASSYY
ncbi:hypothetical protein M422DRAFT_246795 [Sphaerobolus stellatus SS14]|nr:hypothetical protein M422DRAFT_246795 [Sphaerobolus stellatus SS14]